MSRCLVEIQITRVYGDGSLDNLYNILCENSQQVDVLADDLVAHVERCAAFSKLIREALTRKVVKS